MRVIMFEDKYKLVTVIAVDKICAVASWDSNDYKCVIKTVDGKDHYVEGSVTDVLKLIDDSLVNPKYMV